MMAQRLFAHVMLLIAAAGAFSLVYVLTDIATVGLYLIVAGIWIVAGASILI